MTVPRPIRIPRREEHESFGGHRLERILGTDLDDEHARLALHIALRARRYGAAMHGDDLDRSPGVRVR